MNGLLDAFSLEGSLSCGLMFAALGAAAFRLNMAKGRGFGLLAVWMAAVLAAAPVVGGLGGLRGFPVPWALAEAGAVWSWCAAVPAVLMAVYLWMKSGPETGTWLKAAVSLLALLAVWDVFAGAWPELMQFSLSARHVFSARFQAMQEGGCGKIPRFTLLEYAAETEANAIP